MLKNMLFVDSVKIKVKAGDGGKGCVSFRRERYIPRGGPNGGNGGHGGHVVIEASNRLHTLLDLRQRQHCKAEKGRPGLGSDMHGANGKTAIIKVPLGTLVKNLETEEIMADLTKEKEQYVVAKGGMGGKGNAHFKSSTNKAPRYAQPGIPGEEFQLFLELKMMADVGIIGLPNAGKSTFISSVSRSHPKIANYPFTTLTPNLGVVEVGGYRSFVAADIPGLIEGAHKGKGLGIQFLKHIERTKVLLHTVDFANFESDRGPIKDFEVINHELREFSEELAKKPQVVVANKNDVPEARERFEELKSFFEEKEMPFFSISAVTGQGVKELVYFLMDLVEKQKSEEVSEEAD